MFSYIEKIREKPEHARRLILFVSVGVIMFIIIAVWLSTVSVRFSTESKIKKDVSNKISPFSIIGGSTTDFYHNLKNKISDIKR
jgi:hypothetical protein